MPTAPTAVASIGSGSSSGTAPHTVVFVWTGSSDPDGTLTAFRWDWDDGSPVDNAGYPNTSHTFFYPGTYTVQLTVIDNDGLYDTDTIEITVDGVDDPCDDRQDITSLIDIWDYPYEFETGGGDPTENHIVGDPNDAISSEWVEPGGVRAIGYVDGPIVAGTNCHLRATVTGYCSGGTSGQLTIMGGWQVDAATASDVTGNAGGNLSTTQITDPHPTSPVTLETLLAIPEGTYQAIWVYVQMSAAATTWHVSGFEAHVCHATLVEVVPASGSITGGFVTSPVHVGDAWEFDASIAWADTTTPSVSLTWEEGLGSLASIEKDGTDIGSFSSGDALDLSSDTSPVALVITGIATVEDASADMTLQLSG